MTPLNLARHPFRNERLPATLFALGAAALLALTAWQTLTLRRLLPADADTFREEVRGLDERLDALEREERTLLEVRPAAEQVAEWRRVQELVDRRVFAWTALLGRLEELLPPGVRLLSILPVFDEGIARLDVTAVARGREQGFELVRALQQSGAFDRVMPQSVDFAWEAGPRFTYTMRYRPPARAHPPEPSEAPVGGAP